MRGELAKLHWKQVFVSQFWLFGVRPSHAILKISCCRASKWRRTVAKKHSQLKWCVCVLLFQVLQEWLRSQQQKNRDVSKGAWASAKVSFHHLLSLPYLKNWNEESNFVFQTEFFKVLMSYCCEKKNCHSSRTVQSFLVEPRPQLPRMQSWDNSSWWCSTITLEIIAVANACFKFCPPMVLYFSMLLHSNRWWATFITMMHSLN